MGLGRKSRVLVKKKNVLATLFVALLAVVVSYKWQRKNSTGDTETVAKAAGTITTPRSGSEPPFDLTSPFEAMGMELGSLLLEGQIIDSQGVPVESAEVRVLGWPDKIFTTNSDGTFSFPNMPEGPLSLSARAGNLVGGPHNHLLTAESDPVVLRLFMGSRLNVKVVDESGNPVANSQVRTSLGHLASTNTEGLVSFRGARNTVEVSASAAGYAASGTTVQIPKGGSETSAELMLIHGTAALGHVVNERGQPVVGARIVPYTPSEMRSGASHNWSVSDDGGVFRFETVPKGIFQFTALHPDYAPSTTTPISFDGATLRSDLEIVMSPGATISGRVVDSSKSGVASATVRMVVDNADVGPGNIRATKSDESGAFTLTGLPRETVSLIAEATTGTSSATTIDLLTKTEVSNLLIQLDQVGRITGIVVDETGEPVPEVKVVSWPDSKTVTSEREAFLAGERVAHSDGAGKFTLGPLEDGVYEVVAITGNAGYDLPVSAKPGTDLIELVVPTAGAISGGVEFTDGGRPNLIAIELTRPPATPFSGDKFSMQDITPGRYRVRIRGPEFTETSVGEVEIGPGQQVDLGTIQVSRGRTVSGRVIDANGSPVSRATVAIGKQLIGDSNSMLASGIDNGVAEELGLKVLQTDERGEFSFPAMGDEDLVVAAEHPRVGRSQAVRIPTGSANAKIELTTISEGQLSGVATRGGTPAAKLRVAAVQPGANQQFATAFTNDNGAFQFAKLAPGDYTITLTETLPSGMRSFTSQTVSVAPGQSQKTTADLLGGSASLTVEVLGPKGELVPADVFWFSSAEASLARTNFNRALVEIPGYKVGQGAPAGTTVLERLAPGNATLCAVAKPGIVCKQHPVANSTNQETTLAFDSD